MIVVMAKNEQLIRVIPTGDNQSVEYQYQWLTGGYDLEILVGHF